MQEDDSSRNACTAISICAAGRPGMWRHLPSPRHTAWAGSTKQHTCGPAVCSTAGITASAQHGQAVTHLWPQSCLSVHWSLVWAWALACTVAVGRVLPVSPRLEASSTAPAAGQQAPVTCCYPLAPSPALAVDAPPAAKVCRHRAVTMDRIGRLHYWP